MNNKSYIMQCQYCKAKNRIPENKVNDKPLCGKCHKPLPEIKIYNTPVNVSDDTFNKEIILHPGPVLLDCWAPWCGPCKMMTPVIDQAAMEYAGRVKIAKLNVDQNPIIASRYKIMSIPTLMFFKNGQMINRVAGAIQKTELDGYLQTII